MTTPSRPWRASPDAGGGAPSNPTPLAARIRLTGDRHAVERAQRRVMDAVHAARFDETAAFAIRLALEEALANAVKHGNEGDPRKSITLEYRVEPGRAFIAVEDQGQGFNPDDVPDPTLDENLTKPGGRGLMLMRAYMTEVTHNPRGNRVRMSYVQPKP